MITALPLEKTWPLAEPAIQETCRRLGYLDSLPGTLYDLCATNKAWLYTCREADTFAIVQPRVNAETGVDYLFVWAVCNSIGEVLSTQQGNDYLDELARSMDCKEIRFQSVRKGFERTGWKIDHIIYSRPVKEA